MGYYSRFTIGVQGKAFDIEEINADLIKQSRYVFYTQNAETIDSEEEIKWYEADEDMIAVSKKYPNLLFTMDWKGEDGARGRTYFKNGKWQIAEVKTVYEEFDEKKLR